MDQREIVAGVNEYERVADCGSAIPCLSNPWVIHVYHLDDPGHDITTHTGCWCEPNTEIHNGIHVVIHGRRQ